MIIVAPPTRGGRSRLFSSRFRREHSGSTGFYGVRFHNLLPLGLLWESGIRYECERPVPLRDAQPGGCSVRLAL